MKKSILILVLILFFVNGFAQADKQNIKVVTNTEPSFPKGDNALFTFVYMNLKYSDES